ncbi:dTDP-glucose 4,6-dehydratase [Actinomadura sp. DSM 109109]|nr:dTDP-glucose 4,6-dehydratase [Actinomadura lepetitiana]
MRILVTGGAGFVGSHYVRRLLAPGGSGAYQVTVLDKLTYAGNPANLDPVRHAPGFAFVQGDVADAAVVDDLVAGHDAVVHFAAESHVDRSIRCAQDFVATNVLGTQTLLEAALRNGTSPFVHVSTDEVYGSIGTGRWSERDPLAPSNPYAASKAAADLVVLACHRTYGMDVRITRGSNTYGPYQFPEKIVPLFVTELLDGGKVPLYGDGLHVREWLHVDDHCRAVHLALTRGRAGEVYNIGGVALTNRELTGRLLAECGADWGTVSYVEDRKGHDRRYAMDCTKIETELGFRPRRDLATGLPETVAWYRDNREWWEPLKMLVSQDVEVNW